MGSVLQRPLVQPIHQGLQVEGDLRMRRLIGHRDAARERLGHRLIAMERRQRQAAAQPLL